MKNLSIYKYFKGEKENPFDKEKQNTSHQFWGYEQLFEWKFDDGDFTAAAWIPPFSDDEKEWETVLSGEPVNKEELFKLWLFDLLMVRLPEKHQDPGETFLRLYYDTEV